MNISAGTGVPVFATTVTRDAAFGGASEKVLAEGQLCYLSSTNVVQYYDGAAWATVGPTAAAASGLVLISATTIGTTVSSVTVSSAFSATYDAYKIVLTGGICSANNAGLVMTLGASATTYSGAFIFYASNGSTSSAGAASGLSIGTTSWSNIGTGSTNVNAMCMEIQNPFLTTFTYTQHSNFDTVNNLIKLGFGVHSSSTSFTAFTIATSTGTMTGGTIAVYGYAKA
jgi:hypothetical protein